MAEENAPITFSFAGLPEEYCFSGFNRFALDIVAGMSGFMPGQFTTIIRSDTEPSAEDRGKLWFKEFPGGAPTGKLYSYFMGEWVYPHPVEASSEARMWWAGTESDLWSFDGGDGTDPSSSAPTATTGAMWERDKDYDFRFPLGMGTSPAPLSTVVNPGDTGGNEQITQTVAQMPAHGHVGKGYSRSDGPAKTQSTAIFGTTPSLYHEGGGHTTATTGNAGLDTVLVVDDTGDGGAMNIMPPFRTGIMAKRTSRIYFVA